MFSATPGLRWADADYSQLELRVVADLSADEVMSEVFGTGGDIHTSTMAGLSARDVEEIQEALARNDKQTVNLRRLAKCVNFGILYGVGPKTLMKLSADAGAVIDYDEAQQAIDKWRGRYKGVELWMKMIEETAIRDQYVTMPSGRRRSVVGAKRTTPEGQRALRQATNAPVQGMASEITLTAMLLLHQWFTQWGGGRLLLNVHDQIGLEFDPAEYSDETIKEILHELMVVQVPIEYERRFGYKMTVPLGIDVSIGERWS